MREKVKFIIVSICSLAIIIIVYVACLNTAPKNWENGDVGEEHYYVTQTEEPVEEINEDFLKNSDR